MKINSNSTAVITNNYLLRSEKALSKSSERLSSGKKINNASDNPSGYAISSKMRAQIKGLEKATDNADQGVDFVETTDGALQEVHSICQRMNELAVQASNGTMTTADREAIQEEITQLCDEIERISEDTEFNDQKMLNGSSEYKGYISNTNDVKIAAYSDETSKGNYILKDFDVSCVEQEKTDDSGNVILDGAGNPVTEKVYTINGGGTLYTVDDSGTETAVVPAMTASLREGTNIVCLKNNNGEEIDFEVQGDSGYAGDLEFELPKVGALRVQVGANEGQVIEMNIPEVSLKKMGLEGIDVTSQKSARDAISRVSAAIDYTSSVRSKLGAYQNRMEHAINSLDVTVESTESSYSTIVDTDMASEMTEYTKLQVLQQAGTSMLAQANEFPQQALQLLQ